MTAVAAAAGAPSGSLYHRFPGRPALLAALWLRTLERFHAGILAVTAESDEGDVVATAVALAQHTVTWSRAHHDEARVLLYGATDFGRADWPAEARERMDASQAAVIALVRALARALGQQGRLGLERVVFAIVDIPLALVRRHLAADAPVPRGAEQLIEPAVRALVTGRTDG